MRVIVTGSTGLIGTAVVDSLLEGGHEVIRFVRPQSKGRQPGDILWDPLKGTIDYTKLDACDAVIHLAGENVAGRWTRAKKERIYQSRVKTTELLYDFVEALNVRPEVFVAASGISYCGDCGDGITTEETPKGRGFLCDVSEQREAAAMRVSQLGPRVVMTRFAMVLSPEGGVLKKILPAFEAGLGGVMGSGVQYWPWVSLEDTARAVVFAMENAAVSGPVNVVSPQAVTNAEFTRILGDVLGKATFCRKPEGLIKLVLGQFGEELVLASNRAAPEKLLKAGFQFRDEDLAETFEGMLHAPTGAPA